MHLTVPDTAVDQHLPAVHLRPPANWINDPNGLVHHDGWYHVFFQYNPDAPVHRQVHWGHYRSRDLLRWEPLPIALAPSPGGQDADGVFSGNAVSHDGRITAFFSAHREDRWFQPVAAADSDPSGTVFTKRPALLVPEPPEGVTTYRDPYVWRDGERWRMLVGAGLRDGRGAALLYESEDLESWTYRGPLHTRADRGGADHSGSDRGGADHSWAVRTGEAWECPQLAVYEDGRALLLTSAWYQRTGPGHVVAWAGTADGERHHFGAPFRFDHGPDFYAPALLRAPDGRWLLWAWSWEARAQQGDWAGVLTVPREVTLTADGRTRQVPARELTGLRTGRPLTVVHDTLPGESAELGVCASATDLIIRVDFGAEAAWGLRIITGDDDSEFLDLSVVGGALLVDRCHASADPRAHIGTYRMPLPQAAPGHSIELRLIMDHSIAEIFSDCGETLTLRHYPTGTGTGQWRLVSRGLAAHPVRLDLEAHTLTAPTGETR